MFHHLEVAYAFIFLTITLIMICFIALVIIKARNNRKQKVEAVTLAKYQDYFTYLHAHIADEMPPRPPLAKLSKPELFVFQTKIIELMECLKGGQVKQLANLCDELGLVDYNLKRLRSMFHWRRIDAAYQLGAMRVTKAVPELIRLLDRSKFDSSLFVVARSVAKCARDSNDLRQLVMSVIKHRRNCQALIVELLKESSVEYAALWADFLQEKDSDLVEIALIGLTEQVEPGTVKTLQQLILAEKKEVRIKAAKALMRAGNTLSMKSIARLMNHSDWEIRATIAKAIGPLGSIKYIDVLKRGLTDDHWWVRYNSANSLAMLDEAGFIALCEIAVAAGNDQNAEMARSVIHEVMNKHAASMHQVEKVVSYNRQLHIYQRFFGQTYYQQQAK